MNKYLIDTHVFLWWLQDSGNISRKAFEIIAEPNNVIYVSAASIWEMSIKCKLGKLEIENFSEGFFTKQIIENSFSFLPISLQHSCRIFEMTIFHKDPFDHMLIAQAQIENCSLVSKDEKFEKYDVKVLW